MFKLNTFFYHNQKKRGFSAALPASFLRTCRRLPAHGFRNMQSINIQSAVSLKAGTVGTANGKKQTAERNRKSPLRPSDPHLPGACSPVNKLITNFAVQNDT